MAIEFNSLSSNQTANAKPKATDSPASGSVAGKKAAQAYASQDTVRLSDAVQAMSSVGKQTLAATPDVDADKVASLRAAILEGRYEVNSERLADKMMRFDALFD
ncbi:flagellar biosynthesis anti-sigma factor FlgM [Nitrincola tapanii]|uniref:Negative regulator of flagellin synthesis n=1 Tax=Nitrincola tapanii TaxID=1708751 RepID=A0A5A9W761_9GAMM|nr:flagellar biosynthesis anti-sigma factor FlgM [Nitrincola tapanii]KAA0876576.1 flagellar biosynthesis anti-sigma factor FlgM [Nitrincola tapanii]